MTYWEFSGQWIWTGGIVIFWQPAYSVFVHKFSAHKPSKYMEEKIKLKPAI